MLEKEFLFEYFTMSYELVITDDSQHSYRSIGSSKVVNFTLIDAEIKTVFGKIIGITSFFREWSNDLAKDYRLVIEEYTNKIEPTSITIENSFERLEEILDNIPEMKGVACAESYVFNRAIDILFKSGFDKQLDLIIENRVTFRGTSEMIKKLDVLKRIETTQIWKKAKFYLVDWYIKNVLVYQCYQRTYRMIYVHCVQTRTNYVSLLYSN